MSLLDSVLGAVSGKTDGTQAAANPVLALLPVLLAQSGGLQGLMSKFSQAGLGNVFSQWVSTGPNPPVSGSQIEQVLGSEQVQALAAKLGIDTTQVSQLLAQHLPAVVDQLTPQGKIDPAVHNEQGLASMLPGLLQRFAGGTPPAAPPA
jgi:uncharacterized protein YidB (DUF937 family)